MSESACIICHNGDDEVAAMINLTRGGLRVPGVIMKALDVFSRVPSPYNTPQAAAMSMARVAYRNAPDRGCVSLHSTPAALAAAILADDFSDFEGETPEEEYPTVGTGVFIVDVTTGDVVVKSGTMDAAEFNALTTTAYLPAS